MGFRRWHKRQVITAVSVDCRQQCHTEPHPDSGNVRSHDQRSHGDRQYVSNKVLQRMCINGNNTDGSCPFMMDLVDVTINRRMVKQSTTDKEHFKVNNYTEEQA